MGFTDAIGGAIDKAAGALGGADGGKAPKPDPGTPKFDRADPLDPPKEKKSLPVGLNSGDSDPTGAKPADPIEFVHFGKVHADTTDHFAHPKFDNEKGKKPAGRAILFRDAVEREALLLHGFVTATKTIHEELKKNRGPAGDIAGAIGSLVGKSGSEPDPAVAQNLLDDITKAGDKINVETCDYVKIHKAGIDLHQTRADYLKYCTDKLDAYYLKKKDADGATSLLMALPAVAGAAKTIFGILFKAFDIYFAMYLSVREAYEPAIEDACYKFGIDVVKKYQPHTFAPWYPIPKDKPAEQKSTAPGFLADVEDGISDAKKEVDDLAGEVEEKEPAPGEGAVGDVFTVFGSAPSDKKKDGDADAGKDKDKEEEKPAGKDEAAKDKPKPNPADALCIGAFNTVIGTTIPGPIAKGIGKMVWANVEFLKAVYIKLCNDSTKPIDQEWLNETAHTLVFTKLYSFIEDNVGFVKDVENAGFNVQGKKLGPGKLIEKGKDALASKLGSYADPIIKLAVGKLADKLEAIRKDADKNKSLTMEVFFGNLPFLLAMQVRNTTFPVWDMLMSEVVGKGNAALDGALKPVRGFIGDAKNVVDDVKDKKDRIAAAKKKFDDEGLGASSDGQNLTGYKDILFGDKPKKDDDKKSGGGSFPGGARKTAGNAEKIPVADLDKAKGDRKSPWPPPTD